jgi:hypothetical protein
MSYQVANHQATVDLDIQIDSGQLIPSTLLEIVPLVIAARTITKAICRSLSETRGS